jgi:NDP-sugar pyrophosphorylase family protein
MAGAGSRMRAKYHLPKPLIDVNGAPMIQRVVENLNIDRIKEKILYSNWQVPSSKSISFSLDRIRDVYNKGIARNKIYVYDSGKGFKVMVE